MFSNLILRNSRRSRKENGLFFSSLVISIVAFYMILSISTQDVMLFLQKMESDAVDKLLLLIPAFYGMTLGILFFLIYFACKYQFERRRHEFGVYLMLGMRRSKLFGMLLAEDFLTSILAMLIGLPVAVVLSEIVSLVTAKLVGMGIIGHQFSLSWSAIEWTLAGFLAIKPLVGFAAAVNQQVAVCCRHHVGNRRLEAVGVYAVVHQQRQFHAVIVAYDLPHPVIFRENGSHYVQLLFVALGLGAAGQQQRQGG